MKLLILNGPNLNLLGIREPDIYGHEGFGQVISRLQALYPDITFIYRQSNKEGEIIDILHEFGFTADGIILNPGGYTHTSVAIADAVRAIASPVVEVHLSNLYSREAYRQKSLIASACIGIISGFGSDGYRLAVEAIRNKSDIKTL